VRLNVIILLTKKKKNLACSVKKKDLILWQIFDLKELFLVSDGLILLHFYFLISIKLVCMSVGAV